MSPRCLGRCKCVQLGAQTPSPELYELGGGGGANHCWMWEDGAGRQKAEGQIVGHSVSSSCKTNAGQARSGSEGGGGGCMYQIVRRGPGSRFGQWG